MTDADYEILPHQLLSDLKYDVEALKKKLSQPDSKMNELILEIESLKDTIHELTSIFNKAIENTKDSGAGADINLIKEKMEAVVRQNETIASGMVAISDKVDEWMGSAKTVNPTLPKVQMGVQHTMGLPQQNAGPARVAPPPQMPDDLPTPPVKGDSKKSFGNMFK